MTRKILAVSLAVSMTPHAAVAQVVQTRTLPVGVALQAAPTAELAEGLAFDRMPVNAAVAAPLSSLATLTTEKGQTPLQRSAVLGKTFDRSRGLPGLEAASSVAVPLAFTPMSKAQKQAFVPRYLAHLKKRDGVPTVATRRFSIREAFFKDVEDNKVRVGTPVMDQTTFTRNEELRKPEAGLDVASLWALAVAKSNRSERDGVEQALKRSKVRSAEDPLTYIEIEEFYHTRVLRDAIETAGLTMRMLPPHWITRTMVKGMVYLPKFLSNVLILCAEVTGVTVFRMLRDQARVVLKNEPAALARVETLFQQILVDEVGHVHFVRSQLGPVRIKLAKLMMPIFVRYFLSDVPELEKMWGKKALLAEIMKADVDGAAATYPDKFTP